MGDEVRLEENFFQWTITITSFTGRSLGVTKMSGLVHPDQHVRNATQNSFCRAVNRRRGCCACSASNCRRRARFSRTRSSRERKHAYQPTEEMSERHDYSRNYIGKVRIELCAKSFILQVYDILARRRPATEHMAR
jgi:hypothetical protein